MKIASFLVGLIVGVLLTCSIYFTIKSTAYFDEALKSNFQSIRYGMQKKQIIELMGNPWKTTPQFELAQSGGYEFEYASAKNSGSTIFLLWKNGIDTVYAVGFDKEGRAIFKAQGKS